MLGITILEYEDEFMLAAVKRTKPAAILNPNADILELCVDLFPRGKQFLHVPPVNADEMDWSPARLRLSDWRRLG